MKLTYDRMTTLEFLIEDAKDFKKKLEILKRPMTHQQYEHYRRKFISAGVEDPDKTLKEIFNL